MLALFNAGAPPPAGFADGSVKPKFFVGRLIGRVRDFRVAHPTHSAVQRANLHIFKPPIQDFHFFAATQFSQFFELVVRFIHQHVGAIGPAIGVACCGGGSTQHPITPHPPSQEPKRKFEPSFQSPCPGANLSRSSPPGAFGFELRAIVAHAQRPANSTCDDLVTSMRRDTRARCPRRFLCTQAAPRASVRLSTRQFPL